MSEALQPREERPRPGLRPSSLLLPALFLFFLGAGNTFVGWSKGRQYEAVIQELQVEPQPAKMPPLLRMELSKSSQERLYSRQRRAQERRDFYGLVELGGKVFFALSFLCLIGGSALFYARQQ